MDALSDALRSLRISGSMFIDADLKAPWGAATQRRMILAARDLSDGGTSVKRVAKRYRYGSEAVFTKAFGKTFGTPPAAFRRGQYENQEIH